MGQGLWMGAGVMFNPLSVPECSAGSWGWVHAMPWGCMAGYGGRVTLVPAIFPLRALQMLCGSRALLGLRLLLGSSCLRAAVALAASGF